MVGCRFDVFATLAISLACLVSNASSWGSVGHEIVATIAQTQLHPAVRAHLCNILPRHLTSYRSNYPRGGAEQWVYSFSFSLIYLAPC